MRSPRGLPFTLRRMGMHRPVLAAVALLTLITAALVAALAAFAGQALNQAVQRKLATAPGTSIVISGETSQSQYPKVTAAIGAALSTSLGHHGYTLAGARWSNPLKLPARYAGISRANVPLGQAAALPGLAQHAVLLSGTWAAAPQPGRAIAAAVPADVATALHLRVGDTLALRDQVTGLPVRIAVSGIFRPRPGPWWSLNLIGASGSTTSSGFVTYGPLAVSTAALGSAALPASEASWLAGPVPASIHAGTVGALATRLASQLYRLRNSSTLAGVLVHTSLPSVLSGIASNLVVSRSVLGIGAVQLLLLAAIALGGTATLLAADRENESALLAARGTSRWQRVKLGGAEAAVLAVAAVVAGGLVGGWLAGLLARTGALQGAGLRLSPVSGDAALAVLLTAVGVIALLLGPSLRTVSPGVARVRSGRQAAIAFWVRSGADLVLVGLAALAVWQLHRALLVTPSASGTIGIDPVLVIAPALALAGGTVLLLRLLPPLTRAGDRLGSRGNRLVLSLAAWEVARHPVRQASVALLVVMAVATGTLAVTEHQSWLRSAHDQAAFSTGADVRVDAPAAVTAAQTRAVSHAPGVRQTMLAAPLTTGGSDEVLAVGAGQAASTVLLRPDESSQPAAALFRAVTPAGRAPGVLLPGRPTRFSLTLSLGPAALHLAPVPVVVSVQDASGNVYQLAAGTLTADGRPHTLTAALGAASGGRLRVVNVQLNYTLPPHRARGSAQLSVLAVGPGGTGSAVRSWTPAVVSAQLSSLRGGGGNGVAGPSALPVKRGWRATAAGAQTLTFDPGYGLAVASIGGNGRPTGPPTPVAGQLTLTAMPPQIAAVPAIATRTYLHAHAASVGSADVVDIPGLPLPVRIVAAVATFPSIPAGTGGIVVDLAALQDYLVSHQYSPEPVTEWWLATGGPPPAGLARRLPPGSAVTTVTGRNAALTGDPLSAVPQQALLAIAVAVTLLAVAGFFVSIAAGVRQRRPRTALLAALGVTRRTQALQLALEEVMISVPAAVTGLLLGWLVSVLLVPSVTLTTTAQRPTPPVLTELDWPLALPLALAVAVLPVAVAALAAARRPDPAATLRATELV